MRKTRVVSNKAGTELKQWSSPDQETFLPADASFVYLVIRDGIVAGVSMTVLVSRRVGASWLLRMLMLPALFLSAHLGAQQTSPNLEKRGAPSGDLVIRKTVSRVLVDIVVTDKNGNPVHGLTQDDFSLKEDGKPQRLLSFDVHDDTKPDYVPPKIPPLPVNTFVDVPKEPEQGPLYVILYDMVNMDREDQASSRKPLLDFIDSKPPGTRFAIFLNADGTKLIQGFTSDRALLHAALTSQGSGPHLPRQFLYGNNYGQGNTGATVSLFSQLTTYLNGIHGRKNLLWLAGQFPLELHATANSILPQEEIKQVMASMTRSQISIYTIDVRGVMVYDESLLTDGGAGSGKGAPGGGATEMNSATTMGGGGVAADFMNEKDIAEATGGHAVDQGASFYTVSYSSPNPAEDGSLHNIEVSLGKSGYHLEYRRFYYAVAPDAEKKDGGALAAYRAAAKQNDTLYGSIEHGAPLMHDLLFSSHVRIAGAPAMATPQQMLQIQDEPAYFRTRRRNAVAKPMPPVKLQKYLIDYLVIDQQLKAIAAQTGRQPMLEFAAAAYDMDGRMLNGIANDATAAPPSTTGEKSSALFRVEQELDVPLQAAWLRIAVRDMLTDRTGALEIPLPLKAEPVSQARTETK
jgi:VWFA-related protein